LVSEAGRWRLVTRPAWLQRWRRRLRFLRRLRFTQRLRFISRPVSLLRLGLRTRITIAFGVGALLLSTMVGATTWALTQQNWVDEQESSAIAQAFTNADQVQQRVTPGLDDPIDMLSSLLTPSGSNPVLLLDDEWYPVTPQYGENALPPELVDMVRSGRPARMRFDYLDSTQLAVGIPLRSVDAASFDEAAYFEIVSLEELEDKLDSLGISLIGASLATTLAGAALGWWTSRRVIRPLTSVSHAAQAIATGHLETRLEASRDPDLTPLANSFNEMAVALQERIARDSQFTSNVSHELRSPLTTLTSAIEVMQKKRADISVEAHEALDLMDAEIQRFQQLVNDLLEISRFDVGVDQLELHDVRLAELVMHAIGMATEDDLPLDIDAELAGVVVKADKRRLARVIANLIDNANKYGGGATRVELRKRDGDVLIAVEDDGPGVPEEDRERIFQRFNRGSLARSRRDIDGVGLGLALVAEHVGIHGGLVWVEDKPDGRPGARFVIALPTEEAMEV
jgi:two-component system sensor histidine kinase MtrB